MSNHLAGETSPYLQQHAGNPVDWHPWGEAALTRAREESKPILLSIGYSACHWCHVMAHESFEDAEVAAVMNRLFVNIKVDREERPDLDQIYQLAHQILTGRAGGWPLTMFLAPDGTPLFGGTYFPKTPRYGQPGFVDLCQRVVAAWHSRKEDFQRQGVEIQRALDSLTAAQPPSEALNDTPLQDFVTQAGKNFDAQHGGYRGAPKFPHPADLELLLRRHATRGDAHSGEMALATLRHMAEGGIYDQLGGGFCRYSVDEAWSIPHFEKMLYDNGPLLRLYADAWLVTKNPLFLRVVEQTAAWVMREMQAAQGGYFSSLDADSEHEEGKFYVWSREEVSARSTAPEYAILAAHYGLDQAANFEGHHWHLRIVRPLDEVAALTGQPLEECERLLQSAQAKLFEARSQRVRPGRDEKILTSWNALMIEGMAHAARVFGRADWLDSSKRALTFLRGNLWRETRLLATCKDGHAHLNAYLDDYAFLLKAVLECLQAEFDAELLDFARQLGDALLTDFADEAGGFWFTRHDHEALIHRLKTGQDNATPSGNGVAAYGLQRLGHLTGELRFLEAAERTLKRFFADMARQPAAFATLLMALEECLVPPTITVLSGPKAQAIDWQNKLAQFFMPYNITLAPSSRSGALPAVLDKPKTDHVNAWVCCGVKCLEPIDDFSCLERVCKSPELI